MRDEDRIDFSALDPSLNEERWAGLQAKVLARVRVRRSMSGQLAAWGVPGLAVAAACALAVWAGPLLESRAPASTALQSWSDEGSPSAQLIELVGGYDDGDNDQ